MSIHRVVVEIDFRIEGDQAIVFGQKERIDFQNGRVHFNVSIVERKHKTRRFVDEFRRDAETERELASLKAAQADRRIDCFLKNQFGRFFGDFFDVHSARARRHKNVSAACAIQSYAEIKLFINRQAFFDKQSFDLATFGSGLMRDEHHSEHFGRDLFGFFGRFRQFYAAAFAASARVNLRFDDNNVSAEFFRRRFGFFGRRRDDSARHRNAVIFKKFFPLIFVYLHRFII